jgi:hypothetical protein
MSSRDGYRQDHEVVFHLDVRALLTDERLKGETMSVDDEMANERNREIANDNYYSLKWLNSVVDEFLAKLAEARAMEQQLMPRPPFTLDEVHEWTAEMRKLRR